MIPIFSGLESPDHLNTLKSVRDDCFGQPPPVSVRVSYKSLRSRRLGQAYVERLAEDFSVVLEAGVFSTPLSDEAATEFAMEYYAFVAKVPQVVYAVEFEHPAVHVPAPEDPRFVPVLSEDVDLDTLAETLDARGLAATGRCGDVGVSPVLRRSTGLAMTLREQDLSKGAALGYSAAVIQAWLYPAKYGEIILWDGKFRRHSVRTQEDRARLVGKYRQALQTHFDPEMVLNREAREVTRVAAYAYLVWGLRLSVDASLALDASLAPTTFSDLPSADISESANSPALRTASVHSIAREVKEVRSTEPLPFFSSDEVSALEEDSDGLAEIRSRKVLRVSDSSARRCGTCSLSTVCPAFQQDASCKFGMPVEARTPAQIKAVMAALVEMQAARVGFAMFAEQVRGDHDPVVGQEMDRLMRLADRAVRVDDRRERVSVTLESEDTGGGTGVLSRIFGARAQVPAPPVLPVIAAEVIDDATGTTSAQ